MATRSRSVLYWREDSENFGKSPVCNKVSSTTADLARYIIGQGDEVHRDEIDAKGLKFSELLTMQFRSFGGEGHRALAQALEKDTKVRD